MKKNIKTNEIKQFFSFNLLMQNITKLDKRRNIPFLLSHLENIAHCVEDMAYPAVELQWLLARCY